MSIQVRVPTDVAVRVTELAEVQRRSFANMVEVLLLQSLERAEVPSARSDARLVVSGGLVLPEPSVKKKPSVEAAKVPGVSVGVRAHMRGDRPMLECPERVVAGNECPKCGRVV